MSNFATTLRSDKICHSLEYPEYLSFHKSISDVFFGKLPQTQSKRIISFEETRKFEEKIEKKHFFLIKFSHFSPGLGSPDGNALGVDNIGSI